MIRGQTLIVAGLSLILVGQVVGMVGRCSRREEPAAPAARVESRLLTRADADDALAAPASEVHASEVLQRFGEPFARVREPGRSAESWLYDIDDSPSDWVLAVEVQADRVVGARRHGR